MKICSIPDCNKKLYARTWCRYHYTRWYLHGDPLHVREYNNQNTKKTHCKRGHEFTEENTQIVSGTRRCRACEKQLRNQPRERFLRKTRETAYQLGLDLALVREVLTREPNCVCEICGGRDSHQRLSIDHCHKTGSYRGLLCDACNTMIARGKDDPAILRAAAEYLERTNES